MKEYTVAYSARSRSGWTDEKGDLFDDVMFTASKDECERMAARFNAEWGRPFKQTDDYLEFYVEEVETIEE